MKAKASQAFMINRMQLEQASYLQVVVNRNIYQRQCNYQRVWVPENRVVKKKMGKKARGGPKRKIHRDICKSKWLSTQTDVSALFTRSSKHITTAQ